MTLVQFLSRWLFVWRVPYPTRKELDENIKRCRSQSLRVIVVTQEIGLCKGLVPGRGNGLLANALYNFNVRYPDVPILAQVGAARAAMLIDIPIAQVIGPPEADTPNDRSTLAYSTESVVRDQATWMRLHGYDPARDLALYLTTPDHAPRTRWVMEKQGFKNLLVLPLCSYRQRDYFDPTSLYLSVRLGARSWLGVIPWYLREVISRPLFFLKGWI